MRKPNSKDHIIWKSKFASMENIAGRAKGAGLIALAAGGLYLVSAPQISVAAGAGTSEAGTAGAGPSQGSSLLGSYLAARHARRKFDTGTAAAYLRYALRLDPNNLRLLEPAFLMETSEGNWDQAVPLARRLIVFRKKHRVAHLLLGLTDVKNNDLDAADKHFKAASSSPIGELTGTLARSWVALAKGQPRRGIKLLRALKKAEGGQFHVSYQTGLIAGQAGLTTTAHAAYARVFKIDKRALRVALAYSRQLASEGDIEGAKKVLKRHVRTRGGVNHRIVNTLLQRLKPDQRVDLLVRTPHEGLAEVFYGLGEALIGVGAVPDGAVYLHLALYMRPSFPFALEALANTYEARKKFQLALATYDRIPNGSPLQPVIALRKAMSLNQLDRVDEAKELLETLARQEPDNINPLAALGNIMRARKRYGEAVVYYDKVIKLIKKPTRRHWSYFYFRGTCYERIKQWPKAERDLQTALKLNPNQTQVLNYLGYSWVDQNSHLKQGMKLIEKAVRLKPDDGYIVDSLGWAHYRLKNYKKAAKLLERAVELRPEDPILNDHLGDAFWRTGRKVEAKFQWQQALTLKPEPANALKIRKKLKAGLPDIKQAKIDKTEKLDTQ